MLVSDAHRAALLAHTLPRPRIPNRLDPSTRPLCNALRLTPHGPLAAAPSAKQMPTVHLRRGSLPLARIALQYLKPPVTMLHDSG